MSSSEGINDDNVNPSAVAASTSTPSGGTNNNNNNDDLNVDARKMLVLRQLTSVYKFDTEAAEKAVDEVGADRTLAIKYILDNNLASDSGGMVSLKQNCPHVRHHVKISLESLPDHPNHGVCAYNADDGSGDNDANQSCSADENWLCVECGFVLCSRYSNRHCLTHWKETKAEQEEGAAEGGHCIAVSLADLSAWCHECDAYLHDPVLDPIVQRLEQLKFEEVGLEPKKKKLKSAHHHHHHHHHSTGSNDDPSSGIAGQSSANENDENDDDEEEEEDDESNDEEEEEEEEEDASDSSEQSPTIISVANAVARGVPIEMFTQQQNEEEEIDYPFDTLPTSLEDVAAFIQSDKCRNIVILAGAGMSVSAGIPDFRSADGLYATMKPDLLTADPVEREAIRDDPTVALEQGMFLQNPLPCLELNREFILGTHEQRWKATLAHRFVELLHAKTGKLARMYTQNIDGLEDQCTQLPRDKVIAVHGSMDRAACANCGEESDFDDFCEKVKTQIKDLSEKDESAPAESSPIACTSCSYRLVKPAIVLFRSPLPRAFFENAPRDIADVDLLIVMGTSLRVAPANSLVWRAPKSAMRLLVNREPVGWHLGMKYGQASKRDYFAQGDCDSVLLNLMTHLGWVDDLEPLLSDNKFPDKSAALLQSHLARESEEDESNYDGDIRLVDRSF